MNFIQTTPFSWLSGVNTKLYFGIQYGSINKERLDVIVPTDATEPTPAIINIHGGSFVFGSKENSYDSTEEQLEVKSYVDDGIAYISLSYDLLEFYNEKKGIISCMDSCTIALQFVKYYADFFNIDKTKIALSGGSAGAGIALWISSQPNLAEPANSNQIFRESTDVVAVALKIPQASYDFQVWEDRVFNTLGYNIQDDYNLNQSSQDSVHRSYAINSLEDMFTEPTVTLRSRLDMLGSIDANSGVPTFIVSDNPYNDVVSNGTIEDINHNALHGKAIMDALVASGVEVVAYLTGLNIDDPSGETKEEFLRRKLI
ncbi:MAG: acetyl esterase/lipase [Francisellaceae bacterium]|jgi:acetyl esterase/lipase